MSSIKGNKVWVVDINWMGDIDLCEYAKRYCDGRNPIHYYFDEPYHVFENNHKAVKFIREKAEKAELFERFIDVDWLEGADTDSCIYLSFDNRKRGDEYSVFFTLKEVM